MQRVAKGPNGYRYNGGPDHYAILLSYPILGALLNDERCGYSLTAIEESANYYPGFPMHPSSGMSSVLSRDGYCTVSAIDIHVVDTVFVDFYSPRSATAVAYSISRWTNPSTRTTHPHYLSICTHSISLSEQPREEAEPSDPYIITTIQLGSTDGMTFAGTTFASTSTSRTCRLSAL